MKNMYASLWYNWSTQILHIFNINILVSWDMYIHHDTITIIVKYIPRLQKLTYISLSFVCVCVCMHVHVCACVCLLILNLRPNCLTCFNLNNISLITVGTMFKQISRTPTSYITKLYIHWETSPWKQWK